MRISQFTTQYFIFLLSIMPIAASAQHYVISTDGSEVTDQNTFLIWKRCAEGMDFLGDTCTGSASTFTHEAALRHAKAQADSTGIAWRLPNVKELASIYDLSLYNRAIDEIVFPATPYAGFWSSTPYTYNNPYAYGVFFDRRFSLGYVERESPYMHVRLVRAGR